ncbi:MAG TPA: Eco57I restriction-modification methylase domain-containing protein [Clostridia bacterium]|nr:Eco57I restriction-modification methylase domain-containing protein [Clostridia bacterium]
MKLLDEVVEKPFDLGRFIKFSTRLFYCPESADNGEFLRTTGFASDFAVLNRFICSEGTAVAILAVNSGRKTNDVRYGSLERKQIEEVLVTNRCEAAIAAFYIDGVKEWKLSLIRLNPDNKAPGDTRALNNFKLSRVSYILGGGGGTEAVAVKDIGSEATAVKNVGSEVEAVKEIGPEVSLITGITRTAARKLLLKLLLIKKQRSIKDLEKAFSLNSFKKEVLKKFNRRYTNTLDFSALVKLPGFRMSESEPYDRILAIDPEMLGDLFESRLDTNVRKNKGTFYTPSEIVSFMCRESLAHYISNAAEIPYEDCRSFLDSDCLSGDGGDDLANGSVSGLSPSVLHSFGKIDDALRQVRIFDPAAGSGAFVLGILKEIVRVRAAVSTRSPADLSESNAYRLMLYTVVNCIYAMDIDEDAVRITRLRLWCALASAYENGLRELSDHPVLPNPQELPDLARLPELPGPGELPNPQEPLAAYIFGNIISGSSLGRSTEIFDNSPLFMETVKKKGGFDIVIGNPPYISAIEGARYAGLRRSLKSMHPLLRGSFDIYAAFLLEGIRQTNDKGVYCWIVPNSLLSSHYASPVLEYLKENGLRQSYSVSDADIFHSAGVYPVIVAGNKGAPGGEYAEYGMASEECQGCTRSGYHSCTFIRKTRSFKTYGTFKEHGLRFASGTAGFQARAIAACITEERIDGAIPFVVSGSIDKYCVGFENIRYMGKTYKKAFVSKNRDIAQSKWKLWCDEKIVIAGLTRELEADYCQDPLALGVGAYALYGFGGYDPLFLLGLLNSRFMAGYIGEQFHEKHLAGGYLAINKAMLEQLPLEPAGPELQREIAEKAAEIKTLIRQFHVETLENEKVQETEALKIKPRYENLIGEIDEFADWFYGR